jgi:hypothetical protein
MQNKLTPLVLGPLTKPTREMISSLIEEAMSFPPGRLRVALLNQARNLEKRLEKFNELDGRHD